MRIFSTLLLILALGYQAYTQEVSLNLSSTKPLGIILKEIEVQSGIRVNVKDEWIDGFVYDKSIENKPPAELLRNVLKNKGFTFIQHRGEFYVFPSNLVSSDLARFLGVHLSEAERSLVEAVDLGESYAALDYFDISGSVLNSSSDEPITGAVVRVKESALAVATDLNGRFNLHLPVGRHTLMITSIGFEENVKELIVSDSETVEIEMYESSLALDELVIFGNSSEETLSQPQSGLEIVNLESIKNLPSFLGELDVIKTITSLPGVSTVGEGAGGFNVRGGNIDENLILFNGIPIFNSSHLFGFFSVFNADVIDNFELYKGGIPANYGGRVSSILNVSAKDGNFEKIKYNGNIGLISSKLTVDGPIHANGSFVLGVRHAYPTHMLNYFPDPNVKQSTAGFQDFNFNYLNKVSKNGEIQLSTYFSNDQFSFAQDTVYKWNNVGVSLGWNNRLNANSAIGILGFYSGYQNTIQGSFPNQGFDYKTEVKVFGLNTHFLRTFNANDFAEIGIQTNLYNLNSGQIDPTSNGSSAINPVDLGRERAIESGLYITGEKSISNRISIQAGLRLNYFGNLGKASEVSYLHSKFPMLEEITDTTNYNGLYNGDFWLEPRLAFKYSILKNVAFKMGYNHIRQNIHVVSITSAVSPSDYWKLRDPNMPETSSHQLSAGLQGLFKQYSLSLETYYKHLDNILDYRDGGNIFLNPNVETALILARGKSYGVEFKIEKSGRLNGWMSYTYSRSFRYHSSVSKNWYPAQFDKPHNLSINAIYKIRKRTSISTNTVIMTGRAITVPEASYYQNDQLIVHYSERNAARTPTYHRTDVSLTLDGNYKKRGFKGSWVFSIYNIYGRRNPYSIYFDTIAYGTYPQGYKLSILGSAFPSISYKFSIL